MKDITIVYLQMKISIQQPTSMRIHVKFDVVNRRKTCSKENVTYT